MSTQTYAEGINTQRIALAANLTTMGATSVGTEPLDDLVAKDYLYLTPDNSGATCKYIIWES